jgi:TRAP-type C4-dicarboxylate transport system permease small subunit
MRIIALLKRIFELVRDSCGVIAGLCSMGMMISIVIDVIGRQLERPIYWVTDISLILIVWLAFLGMGWTQADRGHVRVEFVLDVLPKRMRPIFRTFSWFLSLLLCVFLFVAAALSAVESVKMGEGTIGIVHFPAWPARIALAFGLLILCIQLMVDVFGELTKRGGGSRRNESSVQ